MRIFTLLLLLLIALPARAQVSVNPSALDGLAPAKPPSPAVSTPQLPAAKPAVGSGNAPVSAPKPVAPNTPNVASAPPASVVVPPPIEVPTRPPSPVAPPRIAADAPTSVEKLKSGLRLVFGNGRSDLNPASETAVKELVLPAQAGTDGPSYTVTSYAAGLPEDPSTPRRVSLSRALAVRSVLISQGVASTRIYVRAFGPASPGFADGPADRADIVVGPNPMGSEAPPKR